ncbi:uncharacterized protein LOC120359607 [Solenopsis invicta]|uniref:uncharacterized protein LOC120359607 n=1 Tax=Solenopsis invicta TaxID=13686 RepID=UPI00193D62A1|nr:uncharacterized protein LOC120359607 [Solenopsis invicta]
MSLVEAQNDWKICDITFLHSYKTFNLARKAAILASDDKPIDSNIETDYEKPRKHKLPAKFIQSFDDDNCKFENMPSKRKCQVAKGPRQKWNVCRMRHMKSAKIFVKKIVCQPLQ